MIGFLPISIVSAGISVLRIWVGALSAFFGSSDIRSPPRHWYYVVRKRSLCADLPYEPTLFSLLQKVEFVKLCRFLMRALGKSLGTNQILESKSKSPRNRHLHTKIVQEHAFRAATLCIVFLCINRS